MAAVLANRAPDLACVPGLLSARRTGLDRRRAADGICKTEVSDQLSYTQGNTVAIEPERPDASRLAAGSLLLPTEAGYDVARTLWNSMIDRGRRQSSARPGG
jgi:hypothetical protein